MADISLRIKADFEQASAAFKKMESESESLQKKTAKLREEYEKVDKTIQNNISKNQLNSIAISAVKGSEAALRAESAALQRQMIQLIKLGVDPQSEALAKLRNRYTEVQQQIPPATSSVGGFGTSLKTVAGILAGGMIARQLYDIGKASLSAAANMEQQRVAFTTMLGSAEKSNTLLKQIQAFAEQTPFQFNDLVDASKRMIAFGFSSEEVIQKLGMVGNVAAGLSQPIGDMIYLFGQVKTQGRAMTQDLNQFANRGVPIFEEVAKAMGVPKEQVKKLAEEGKITYSVIEKAFQNMTSSGGKFAGLMENQSKTLAGKWSNFNDQLDKTKVLLGQGMEGTAKNELTIASALVQKYNEYLEKKIEAQKTEAQTITLQGRAAAYLSDYNEKLEIIKSNQAENASAAKLYQYYIKGDIPLTKEQIGNLEKKLDLNRSIAQIMKDTVDVSKAQASVIGGEAGYLLQVVAAMKEQQKLNEDKGKKKSSAPAGGGHKKTELELYQENLKKMEQTQANSVAQRLKISQDYFTQHLEAEKLHGEELQAWQEEQASLIANNTKLTYDQKIAAMEGLSKAVKKQEEVDLRNFVQFGGQIMGNASSMFADLITVMNNAGKSSKAFAIGLKITSAAEAGINSFLAFTQVLRDPTIWPTWLRIPLAGTILAAGLAKQAAILSTPIAETGLSSYTVPDIPSYRNDNYPVRAQSGETVTVTPRGEDSTSNTSVSISIQDKQIMSIFQKGVKSGRINVNNKNIRRGVFAH